jgi:Putative MetA-pathway of phenol degradation
MRCKRRIIQLLCCLVLTPVAAYTQIPFYTDDADTTEKGRFHLEIFNEQDVLQRSAYPAKRQNMVVFTLAYGLTSRFEVSVNAPLITISNSRIAEPGNLTGQGDTQLGFKFRLRDEREGSRVPALAVVFYVEAPTGSTRKGLGSGLTDYWLYGIVQKSLSQRTKARLNAGILLSGNESTGLIGINTVRGQIFTGNTSLVRDCTDKLKLGVEVFGAVTNNFKLDRGHLTAQFGGDYALTKKLTLTFGILGGRYNASPRAGVHLGFAYDF